jgi:oxalate decarboxylase
MSDDAKKDMVSRRGFIGIGSAALAAAGMLSAADAAAQEQHPYPTKGDRNSSAPGPGNAAIDGQNPDSFLPPQTDAGGVQTFKYPFGLLTNECRRADGRARSRCESFRFRNRLPAWT